METATSFAPVVTFLLERIKEDEQRATEARDGRDLGDDSRMFYSTHGATRDDWGLWYFAVPIERVLAECKAKRHILAAEWVHEDPIEGVEGGSLAIRHLAAIYADHPDYRPEWRP